MLPTPPVSKAARIAYIVRHLRMAYPTLPAISIGYAESQPQLVVADAAHGFFEQQHPYPAAPNYRRWLGRQIPFFFDPHSEKPLLDLLPEGRAIIHADVISAAFYLLSGWQEYYSEERDQHGRFPYVASVQKRYGFVTIPVVNYYFDVLKTAVEHVTNQPLPPRRWGSALFAACITHDVDNLHSAWKTPAKAALQRRDWLSFGWQLWRHFTQKDVWDNLEEVQQAVSEYGAKSTFFLLMEHRKAVNGTPNADYAIRKLFPRLQHLHEKGAELQLHGSIGTSTNASQVMHEKAQLKVERAFSGIRFHYLSWEPRTTPMLLDDVVFEYDSTLGFAEHYGFRNSFCIPFHPFNFQTGEATRFLEIPLNVMDTTLHHPRYLQLPPDEVLPALLPMLLEIEMFGGVCTVLWHNQNFDPANTHNGPRQFHELMRYLRSRGAAFLTGTEVNVAM